MYRIKIITRFILCLFFCITVEKTAFAESLDEKVSAIVKLCSLGVDYKAQGEIEAAIISRLKLGRTQGTGELLERGAILQFFEKLGMDGETKKYVVERLYNCIDSNKSQLFPSNQNKVSSGNTDQILGAPYGSNENGHYWPISCNRTNYNLSCNFLFEPIRDGVLIIASESMAISIDGAIYPISKFVYGNLEQEFKRGMLYTKIIPIFRGTRAAVSLEFQGPISASHIARIIILPLERHYGEASRNVFADFVGLNF
jgi:hypothetical protein